MLPKRNHPLQKVDVNAEASRHRKNPNSSLSFSVCVSVDRGVEVMELLRLRDSDASFLCVDNSPKTKYSADLSYFSSKLREGALRW